MGAISQAVGSELAAAKHLVQYRDVAQLLRTARTRHGEHRRSTATPNLQSAVSVESRVCRTLGSHSAPPPRFPVCHPRTDRRTLHPRQQRPLSRTVSGMERLGMAEHPPLWRTARLSAALLSHPAVAVQPVARLRLGDRHCQVRRPL